MIHGAAESAQGGIMLRQMQDPGQSWCLYSLLALACAYTMMVSVTVSREDCHTVVPTACG